MSTKVKLEMKPIATILARLGIDKNGRVQRFLTETVNPSGPVCWPPS